MNLDIGLGLMVFGVIAGLVSCILRLRREREILDDLFHYYFNRYLNSVRVKQNVISEAKRQCRRAEFAEGLLNEMFEPFHYPEMALQLDDAMGGGESITLYPGKDDVLLEIVQGGTGANIALDADRLRRLVANLIPYVGGASFKPLAAPEKVAV